MSMEGAPARDARAGSDPISAPSMRTRPAPRGRTGRVLRWLASTCATVLVTLTGLVLVTFLLGHVVPNDPVLKIVGDNAPQETYDRVRRELRLDQPLPVQFAAYVGDLV